MRKTVGTCTVLVALLALPLGAEARTDRELTYRDAQIWNSAIRFLRVDQGFKVLEKDKDAGYLLFEYADAGNSYPATLELVPTVVDGRKVVRARLQIPRMPSYMETVLLDKFLRKLKDEYGAQPPAPLAVDPAAPSSAAADQAGAGGSTGDAAKAKNEQDLETDEDDLEDATKEN